MMINKCYKKKNIGNVADANKTWYKKKNIAYIIGNIADADNKWYKKKNISNVADADKKWYEKKNIGNIQIKI